jgi:hypothetical protein
MIAQILLLSSMPEAEPDVGEKVEKECPEKLRGKTGEENCKESFDDPSVLILNRSPIALNP